MPVFNPNSIARLERDRLVLIRETGRSLRKTSLCPGEWTGIQSFLRFSAISGISGTAREREASVKPLDRKLKEKKKVNNGGKTLYY